MKTLTAYGITFILLLHLSGCNGDTEEKYFTGEIVYRYTYESHVLNTDSLAKERPVKGIFRYDLANYQSRFQGKDSFTYYYSGKLNKALSQAGNSENYTCEDYGMVTDSVISWKLYPTGEKILGQDCDILELQKKTLWYCIMSAGPKKLHRLHTKNIKPTTGMYMVKSQMAA